MTPTHLVGSCGTRVFGLTPAERIARQAPKAGLSLVGGAGAEAPGEDALHLSAACVYGASVLKALASAAPGTALKDDQGRLAAIRGENGAGLDEPARPDALSGAALAGTYDQVLRKREDPIVARLGDAGPVERRIFDATYKGVTDFVTKHVWPWPALRAVRLCVRYAITPNQVTAASAVLVLAAMWLFWIGAFLPGLAVAWVMTFLDTVDGKLARATLTSSPMGDVFDHAIDLIHPPFWWWAWAVGLAAVGDPVGPNAPFGVLDGGWALAVIVAGYVIQRGMEGLFIARLGIEMHIWRPFDSFFRQITARRNPNLVILTVATLLGAPREGLVAVAIWVAAGLAVHGVQIVQGFAAARKAPLTSWLAA